MKSKLVLYALSFFFLFNIYAHAQDITPGYYRVTNLGLLSYGGIVSGKTKLDTCYAYVANGTYHMAKGSGAKQNIQSLQLWTGLDNAILSPQTVIYISKSGSNYNLEAQGTSVSQMTSYEIIVNQVSGTNDTYTLTTTVSGIAASLWVDRTKTGMYNLEGDRAYPTNYQSTTTSQGADAYRQWQLVPISTSSDNYVAVDACLKVKDEEDETRYKYYAPYYASYPFKLVSPGMKAYYVSGITDKKYTLQEITSEVIPEATPVIISCLTDNPADCKIEPLRGSFGSVEGNRLKGVYFCNLSMSPKDYSDCRTEFKKESMRVWAVKDDKLILTNNPDNTRAVPLALSGYSGIWLRPNESYLADVPSTAAAELVSAGKGTTISFDTDGGTEIGDISGGEGEPVTAPASPTKTGYTFTGWDPALPQVFPEEDMTVKAQWQINQYTITFDTDGGATINPITQDYNTAINKPADPTKTGYSFAGWDKEIPSNMPAEDITIKALWNIQKYTITFDTDGGTTVTPINQDYGTTVVTPETPKKRGYTFVGWDKEIPSKMPAENMIIKALWQINEYKLTYYVDGEVYKSENKEYNSDITPEAIPSKLGYSFSGWVETIPEKMPDYDVNITGTFSINRYTITFDTDGGTTITPITQDYNTAITKPSNPTKEGYDFAGWDREIPAIMPAESITIKASWNKLYTISFDTDGADEIASITAVSGTEITKPSDPTKKGHTFAGWTPTIPDTMPEEDLVCKAGWNVNKYKVTFKLPDGKIVSEKEQDYGTAIEVPTITELSFKGWTPVPDATVPDHDVVYEATFDKNTITFDTDGGEPVPESIFEIYGTDISERTKNIKDPTKVGYTFIGWDNDIPSTMPAENMTIRALWQINQYIITFDTDGGTAVYPMKQDYQSTIVAPEAPTKMGYTFNGWNPTLPEKMPLDGFSTKALWKINEYTITFDTNGGTAVNPITQDYNTAINKPADPTKTGYTFIGWDNDIPGTMPAENMTIKAQWQINQYTITFDSDGGTSVNPITQDYQSAITAPEAPTKTGYTFIGWDNIPSTMPANDVTVKAQWQINQYTITFDTDGGSDVADIKQDYQSTINAPEYPTKTGYSFIGWDKAVPSTMPAENMTIKAQWQINQYTITFDTDGGTAINPITQDYNTAITKPSDPTKKGYTFTGWDNDIPSTMPAEDMTIKAQWQINQYTITFDTDGGTTISPITQDYDTKIEVNAPTKDGYDFAGWNPALPETMPAENKDLKAIWGPKTRKETYDFNEGWTWVSFAMFNDEMTDLGTVLSSLKWTSTDEIKGANVWGIYSVKKNKWVGYLAGFNDVTMYKIHSSVDQQLTLDGSYQNSKGNMSLYVDKGWNYLAYLSLKDLPVAEALQNYAASEGDILKSQTQSATYSNSKWIGDLQMEPRKGYMLYRAADNKVSFTYPIALEEEKSNNSRAMRFESKAQRFSSNMNVFATVEGVMAVPGDSIVAYAVDGVRGGVAIDDEGKVSLTILGDNNTDIYLALMHNNTVVASAKAPISYASDNIVGSYANPTAIEFVEGSEAWSGDYNIVAIYTMDGKQLPSTDIKTLTTGLYIIKYETLSDNNSNTSGCRVIRVVR